jgi:hypothetical protein
MSNNKKWFASFIVAAMTAGAIAMTFSSKIVASENYERRDMLGTCGFEKNPSKFDELIKPEIDIAMLKYRLKYRNYPEAKLTGHLNVFWWDTGSCNGWDTVLMVEPGFSVIVDANSIPSQIIDKCSTHLFGQSAGIFEVIKKPIIEYESSILSGNEVTLLNFARRCSVNIEGHFIATRSYGDDAVWLKADTVNDLKIEPAFENYWRAQKENQNAGLEKLID